MEEKPKRKSRLIVRLGTFLASHSSLVSMVCCTAGFLVLVLLPVLAKNTYVSENALMPGSANPTYSSQDVLEANRLVKDIIDRKAMAEGTVIEISRLIAQHMADVGAEVYYHKFQSQINQFRPAYFFSCTPNTGMLHGNDTCNTVGVNSVGILRAPRGDGKEAIVLVTPYNSENVALSEALSVGLAFSIFSLLSRVTWLAKDIVWLAADSRHGEYTSVSAWLNDYHNPVFFSDPGKVDVSMCFERSGLHEWEVDMVKGRKSEVFRRAGTMAAALVLKVVDKKEKSEMDGLTIYAEASNGQMPNLDLVNIVHYLAVHRQGLRVKVGSIGSLLNSAWLKLVGELLEGVGKLTESLNPKWKFGISTADYVEGTATLASSMYYQALGVPTGPHGAFRDYQVDAITLEISSSTSRNNVNGQSAFLLRSGRLIEGVVRSVNNLLEKFHQSFFLYFLTASNKFVSVGVYMIAFALLVVPLPIVAAAIFSGNNKFGDSTDASNQKPSSPSIKDANVAVGSWQWLHAAKVVFMIHLWAVIVSLLPFPISLIPHLTSATIMLIWVALSISTLFILYLISGSPYSHSRDGEWAVLKAMMIAAACIGLGLMSIINFAAAQMGAMLVVPMCLIVQPLKKHRQVALSFGSVLLTTCNLVLGFVGFPPAALLILKGLSEGFGSVGVGDFWEWAEFLWAWNSATYLYLALVHLPCWVLCIHILLHP